eukprot:g12670.t2
MGRQPRKHIVNNCDEEEVFSEPPFDNFLDSMEKFAEDVAEKDEDDVEGLHAFHIFDVNGDGFICKDDLANLLKSGHQEEGFAGISVEEISEIMKEVDQNGDGRMSFEEFMALMADRKDAPKAVQFIRRET